MSQLEHIEAIERRLWTAADTLRANSNYASNEYFLPVMGLVFLRHAYSRYLAVKDDIEANLPKRGGKPRPLTKEDFSQRSAIFLRPEAQFDYLVGLSSSQDRAKAVIEAMESIEADYTNLRGELPKSEYQKLDNDVLGQLLRTLNPDELKRVSGDVFGRIYEYFLTQFADQKAHDNGEFFTPVSLVSLIANVLEPLEGIVLDPACGSGGMFVQSARFVERRKQAPSEKLTFLGAEKNATTIRLAKMNLAVHGLEGNIQEAITYYQDPHDLLGKADFVIANPPFNVDQVDASKIRRDPRLQFGLPGVNKEGNVSNGNYLWISYFYSYLNEKGRAGFVMSSQASGAGRDEAKVRQKLIETGALDVMIAIRTNFFYTRTVPCELWFLDRAKADKDHVLMIDARNIYRKVTRKIYDFSPEQLQNILAIVWLHRGEVDRFLNLVSQYCSQTLVETGRCFALTENGKTIEPLHDFMRAMDKLWDLIQQFASTLDEQSPAAEVASELVDGLSAFAKDVEKFESAGQAEQKTWQAQKFTNGALKKAVERLGTLGEGSRDLVKQADLLYKLACRLIELCEADNNAREDDLWDGREILKARKAADDARQAVVEQLKLVRYFQKQAAWLTERFPDAKFKDVEGLVKRVSRAELEKHDWSLTPGRYVGVAPEEEDGDFDFEETLRNVHIELKGLNEEAAALAEKISRNFEELGI